MKIIYWRLAVFCLFTLAFLFLVGYSAWYLGYEQGQRALQTEVSK